MSFPVHEHCKKMATQENETPWWAAFPEPVSRPDNIEPAKVFDLLEEQSKSPEKPRDFLLVDVRRTDWQGGTVESSINLPAHSFYPTRKIVYDLCKQAGIKKVIFYCGSSNGRGPRCAAWMQDYINDAGNSSIQSLILRGGIRGWIKAYSGRRMDGYDAKVWEGSSS
ncbi:Rhodanese-like domain-containing protein [Coniochaeta sp. 2T2.1]|nr:Rhodanese-like domain-containing protein [Coniochaeta sp. 2T2.1]